MNKREAVKAIKEKDEELGLLREGWMKAGEKKKARYMRMIDKGLDERSELMKIRDGKISNDK
jgi:hypothetical protein